jgi:hypothetical protein
MAAVNNLAGVDQTKTFTCPSIFGALDAAGLGWTIYGYDAQPLPKNTYTDIAGADATHFGLFTSAGPSAGQLSHLEAIREDLIVRYTPGARPVPSRSP